MISGGIAAVNLNCINYEDPTDDRCNDGWLFRKANADIPSPNNKFVKYPTVKIACTGENFFSYHFGNFLL